MQQKAHWWVLNPDWVCISWTLYHCAATGFQPTIHFAVTLFCNVLLFISLFLDVSHTHNTKNTLGEWNWISKRVHIAKQMFKQTASCNICNNKDLKKNYKKTHLKKNSPKKHACIQKKYLLKNTRKKTITHKHDCIHTHTHTQPLPPSIPTPHPHPPKKNKNKNHPKNKKNNQTNRTTKNNQKTKNKYTH